MMNIVIFILFVLQFQMTVDTTQMYLYINL